MGLPAMPRTHKRRPYRDTDSPSLREMYLESDWDYMNNNLEACIWFLENAKEIRRLLKLGQMKDSK